MNNIAIVWDFDGTLTPQDSTTEVISFFKEEEKDAADKFWKYVKYFSENKKKFKEYLPAIDAPIWMYSLSKIANDLNIPLNEDFFKIFKIEILDKKKIQLFDYVVEFLYLIKHIENEERFKERNIKIHHFIVSAGLKDLIQLIFPKDLVTYTYGCRYEVVGYESDIKNGKMTKIDNVPVFCMDETAKTRALFEISKGVFCNNEIRVNTKIPEHEYWVPFKNIVYVGDGDTDVPALSLTRSKGGVGIVVYNKNKSTKEIKDKLHNLSIDQRADLITEANFSRDSELYSYIRNRCYQILQSYEVLKFQ